MLITRVEGLDTIIVLPILFCKCDGFKGKKASSIIYNPYVSSFNNEGKVHKSRLYSYNAYEVFCGHDSVHYRVDMYNISMITANTPISMTGQICSNS